MDCDKMYDQCIDDFMTWDIDNLPDWFLFDCVAKRWTNDIPVETLRQRRESYKPDEELPLVLQ